MPQPSPQLRLAYVNLRVVSRRTKPSSGASAESPTNSRPLPPVALKAARLAALSAGAAAVIEELIDDVLSQIA